MESMAIKGTMDEICKQLRMIRLLRAEAGQFNHIDLSEERDGETNE